MRVAEISKTRPVSASLSLVAAKETAASIEDKYCRVESLLEIAIVDATYDLTAAKETATSAAIDDNNRLVLNGKFNREQVNRLVESYVTQFILCPECKRPDTKVVEKQGIRLLKCEACGAISSVKGL